jgi:hypothetical protein
MITKRTWYKYVDGMKHWYEGWYLFGFIPLYIRQTL